MTHSLANSSVEAHAARAGIPDKNGALEVQDDRFVVTTGSGEYTAKFTMLGQDVEQFTSSTLGRHLTREEAADLMVMIQNALPLFERVELHAVLTRLENNLPNLGFAKDTPLMGTAPARELAATATARAQRNALVWRWALNLE